jgi:acetylornithine deacetylase
VHAATIHGGTGWSTYAEHCAIRLERRIIPGETSATAVAEVQALCDTLRAARPTFDARVSLACAQPPSDLALDAPLTRAVIDAAQAQGLSGEVAGLWCWTDAALFNAAGIPALCFGPGDIARAHSAREWVEVAQLERATDVLEQVCASWGR